MEKVGSALHARGQKALCYRKRQQRTAQNERSKGKVPEADAPNVENQEGGGCLGRLKTMKLYGDIRWEQWMAPKSQPAPPEHYLQIFYRNSPRSKLRKSSSESAQLSTPAKSCAGPVGADHHAKFLEERGKGTPSIFATANRSCMRNVFQDAHGSVFPTTGRLSDHRQEPDTLLLASLRGGKVCCFVLCVRGSRSPRCCAGYGQGLLPRVSCDSKIQCGGRPRPTPE